MKRISIYIACILVSVVIIILAIQHVLHSLFGTDTAGIASEIQSIPHLGNALSNFVAQGEISFVIHQHGQDHRLIASGVVAKESLQRFCRAGNMDFEDKEVANSLIPFFADRMAVKGIVIETNFSRGDPQIRGYSEKLGAIEIRFRESDHRFTLYCYSVHP